MQEAARELGIDSSRITKWRQSHKSPDQSVAAATQQSEEQKLIKRLQKELKYAQLEQDKLKMQSASFPGETGKASVYSETLIPFI